MQLKLLDRVIVSGYAGRQVEGVVVSLDGKLVGITTPAEQDKAARAARDPLSLGFRCRTRG